MENAKELQSGKALGPKDLLLKILKEADVTPEICDDGDIIFHYGNEDEDEVIVAREETNHVYLSLFDYNWHEESQWDIDAITKLQDKINRWNIGNRAKIVYHFNDDDMMVLSSITTVPFIESTPNLKALLTAQLQCLIDSHSIIPQEKDVEEIVSDDNNEKGDSK